MTPAAFSVHHVILMITRTSLPKVIWEQGHVTSRLPGGRLPARLKDM